MSLPAACALAVACVLAAACTPGDRTRPGEERPLEEVEVGEALDSTLDLSEDRKGPRIEEGVSGMLPSDFPADLPLVIPSSLVDYGAAGGRRYVLLIAPRPLSEVRSAQIDRLRRAGWTAEPAGEGWRLRRGDRRATLEIRRTGAVTEIRIEY